MQTREPSGLKGAQDTGPRSVKDTPQPCSSLLQCFTDSCLWKHSIQGMSIWNIPCESSIPTGKVTIILANMVRSCVMHLDLFGEWCQESMGPWAERSGLQIPFCNLPAVWPQTSTQWFCVPAALTKTKRSLCSFRSIKSSPSVICSKCMDLNRTSDMLI